MIITHTHKVTKPGGARPGCDSPVQMGDPLITTIWKALLRDMQEKLAAIFRPEQVAVGVKGGLSIMIHGIRALLQQSPEMVCVKMDLKNAFNEVERAALVEAVREHPQLHSLSACYPSWLLHTHMRPGLC